MKLIKYLENKTHKTHNNMKKAIIIVSMGNQILTYNVTYDSRDFNPDNYYVFYKVTGTINVNIGGSNNLEMDCLRVPVSRTIVHLLD
jgi:hypothetical protein